MLVGRQSELTFISRLLDEARSGGGTFLGLSGEPGIGKTRLAEAAAAVAQSKGFMTFWGQCHDGQYIPPYWPWKEPLRGLLKMLPRPRGEIRQNGIPEGLAGILFEAFRNPDSQQAMPMPASDQARLLILESATALIRRISERRPLLLIMDNIHCADVPSLQLLEVVASEMRAQNLMIIGTYREPAADSRAEFRPAIGALASQAFFHGISLSGWDQAAISEYPSTKGSWISELLRTQVPGRNTSRTRSAWQSLASSRDSQRRARMSCLLPLWLDESSSLQFFAKRHR